MPRYNFRKRDSSKDVVWVEDDTLEPADDSEDEDYTPPSEDDESEDISLVDEEETGLDEDEEEEEEDEEDDAHIQIRMPKKSGISIDVHIESIGRKNKMMIEDEDDGNDGDSDGEGSFIQQLMNKYVPQSKLVKKKSKKDASKDDTPALSLNEAEEEFYETLPRSSRKKLNEEMKKLAYLISDDDVPAKFRVLELPISDSVKANVIKKIDALDNMDMMDGNEGHKLRNWIDGFMRIPFGKVVPLPVKLSDGLPSCGTFLKETRETLDKAVYGMAPAKTQIMQTIAQWISNPASTGNVIALKGPMGVGKTSFARNGIANALKRPFEFFSLGGATDAATFVGHGYTYEGSVCGRIADALMNARCMNPVMYFDELDKISSTSHGEEIASMLIHLTDRSQNTQFHDRYFAGVDFDLSQCLFVFSFNDEHKVHPILRDRMQVIDCSGYNAEEKKGILTKYVWPDMIERINLGGLTITEDAVKYIVSEHSKEEEGVRTLIRAVETLMTRINLLRIADEETAKTYKFYMPVTLPMELTVANIKHILAEEPRQENESWRRMYM
jgi:ATP-dependent Lon protease